jgi:host factor-I protein
MHSIQKMDNSTEDNFLSFLIDEKTMLSVYLCNGVKLKGRIEERDDTVILLRNSGKSQMIYKHSISSIIPDTESK